MVPAVIEMMIAAVPSASWSKPKFLMIGVPPPLLKLIRFGVPYAWNMASGTVSQWVHWLIFWRPLSPSLAISCRRGMAGCMICMMIWAVM